MKAILVSPTHEQLDHPVGRGNLLVLVAHSV